MSTAVSVQVVDPVGERANLRHFVRSVCDLAQQHALDVKVFPDSDEDQLMICVPVFHYVVACLEDLLPVESSEVES